jgi:hypothetical protein
MATEQNRCPETQRLLGGTSLELAFCQTGAQRLAGDVSTGTFHPIVPLRFRKDIFSHFHIVAHTGRLASLRIISSRFVWRGLAGNITTWIHECLAYQGGKIHHHTLLAPSPSPSRSDFFLTFMFIWWARYNTVLILIIFSPSLITHPNGWKLFPFLTCPRWHAQRL